ncbi:ArsR/SmtB family transcription factor [Streptomyces acidiscabies]|uniref:ArsR/SmtB family transcription factor n=1 Tax=Streptomyces acidiscabies TaxID=42234 RepID=UPI0038F6ACF3
MAEPTPDPDELYADYPHPLHDLDARSLRGLAHPLRIQLLTALRRGGPATASQLAEKLGESSGSTSYHLRQLAEYGFVEDAPEHGKGRERWWKAVHDGIRLPDTVREDPDPTVRGAVSVLMHEIATTHALEHSTYVGTARDWSEEWQRAADSSDWTLRLTPAVAAELGADIHRLLVAYDARAVPEDTPDAEQVRIHSHIFPITTT